MYNIDILSYSSKFVSICQKLGWCHVMMRKKQFFVTQCIVVVHFIINSL